MKLIYKRHKDHDIRIKSATDAIKAILPLELYEAHKKELLGVCIWKITEVDGSKSGVRFWSESAINNSDPKLLIHEHVHTRKELIQRLLEGENVEAVLKDAIACVVKRDEHELLHSFSSSGWQRYKDADIKVYDFKNNLWLQWNE